MTPELQRIAAWIASHGFATVLNERDVEVCIPYTCPDGDGGYEQWTVTNWHEARLVLGY